MDTILEPKGDLIAKSPHENVDAEKPYYVNGSIPETTIQCKITPDAALPRVYRSKQFSWFHHLILRY